MLTAPFSCPCIQFPPSGPPKTGDLALHLLGIIRRVKLVGWEQGRGVRVAGRRSPWCYVSVSRGWQRRKALVRAGGDQVGSSLGWLFLCPLLTDEWGHCRCQISASRWPLLAVPQDPFLTPYLSRGLEGALVISVWLPLCPFP